MKDKIRYKLSIGVIGSVWIILALLSWVLPSQEVSLSERRKLAQLPKVTLNSILSGEFMSEFEEYTLDQFPLRDYFRTLKAISTFYVFQQGDNNGIYIKEGYAAKLEYPLNEDSVTGAANKFNRLYKTYMEGKDHRLYFSSIPDKGYFLARKNNYPSMDYERLVEIMEENMGFAQYIDILDDLKLKDYYRTDTHWRQEEILALATKLLKAMDINVDDFEDYIKMTAKVPFYGVYYGQSALPLKSETIHYLTNDILDSAILYNVETGKKGGIYDMEKLYSRDPYEIFLSGAASILYMENPKATTEKELIVFRDSFGSSIAPLLLQGYKKITLVDTRYINSDYVGDYVDFKDQDVLFLYSGPILNNSTMLK